MLSCTQPKHDPESNPSSDLGEREERIRCPQGTFRNWGAPGLSRGAVSRRVEEIRVQYEGYPYGFVAPLQASHEQLTCDLVFLYQLVRRADCLDPNDRKPA